MSEPADYEMWIAAYVERVGSNPLGQCKVACAEMRAVFPELTEVRGHVLCPLWGKRGHIWLVSPVGSRVDPTAAQFPIPGMLVYESWEPGDEVLVGKCMNCGDEIWRAVDSLDADHSYYGACSDACEEELRLEYA